MRGTRRYRKLNDDMVAQLTRIVGDKNIITGEERANYSRDETPNSKPVLPEVVVKPADASQVAQIMKLASGAKIPVTCRGGGTGLAGGAVPIYGGIVLSLEKMNRILEIDKGNFVAVVEPGVILSDLYQAVGGQGLYYPLSPGEKTATIGGTVATNAGGMRAVKYGVTRHFVLGLEAVLPDGEIIQTGGKFVKCSTGYDLTQLIVGSEGTLAVITKIILKLISPPGERRIVFVPFHSLHDAIGCVPEILKEKILPVGIEFLERDIISMVEQHTGKQIPLHDYETFLMIMVEADDEESLLRLANRLGEVCLKHGAIDIFLPDSERAERNLLEAREQAYSVLQHFGVLDIADVVVPRSRIAEFVENAKNIAEEYGVTLIAYGHAGDGNVHLHPLGQRTGKDREKVKELLKRIYEMGVSMGGTISGEHGLGFTKKDYLPIADEKGKIDLMKRIKLAFDPENILNPGKVIDL
ncbi:MAG: FAD-binding protein [Chloroflexi bacterium]|nr:FAD-binding protein [Chloroflexota bacterium]